MISAAFVSRFFAAHRSNDGDVFHHLCHPRPVLSDLQTGHDRIDSLSLTTVGRAGFGIPGIHLTGSTGQPHQNAGALLFAQLCRMQMNLTE